jgi:hypothetical protein
MIAVLRFPYTLSFELTPMRLKRLETLCLMSDLLDFDVYCNEVVRDIKNITNHLFTQYDSSELEVDTIIEELRTFDVKCVAIPNRSIHSLWNGYNDNALLINTNHDDFSLLFGNILIDDFVSILTKKGTVI